MGVSQEQHDRDVARLDGAIDSVRNAQVELERSLRQADADLERQLRAETAEAVRHAAEGLSNKIDEREADLKADINGLDEHLTWQDRAVGGAVLTFVVYAALHVTHLL